MFVKITYKDGEEFLNLTYIVWADYNKKTGELKYRLKDENQVKIAKNAYHIYSRLCELSK